MKSLIKYARTSDLMKIKISLGTEVFKFDLAKEVSIPEDSINISIKRQPQLYSFLGMLHTRMIKEAKTREKKRKSVWAERYIFHLTSPGSKFYKKNNHHPSQKIAESLAEIDPLYQIAVKNEIAAIANRDTIEYCIKSFEQRANLLQTLASNLRAEKN